MKKLLYLTLILSVTTPCYANPSADFKTSPTNPNLEYNSSVVVDKEIDGLDVLTDIPLRVTGLVQIVLGSALFAFTSPITGLMSISHPHTAIDKAADYLVLQPIQYTFDRPTADFNFNSRDHKK